MCVLVAGGKIVCGEGDALLAWGYRWENRYTYESMCYVRIYINTPAVSDPWSEPPNSASDAAAYEL